MKLAITAPKPSQPATRDFLKSKTKNLLINNEWVKSAGSDPIPTLDPATGDILGYIQSATEADVDAAVKAARAAFRSCLLYTSPSPRDGLLSRMPSSA